MSFSEISQCVKDIENRGLPNGGFSECLQGDYRPDSTAWAVLALKKAGIQSQCIHEGKAKLAKDQLEDGRVSFPGKPDVFWPTSLAILSWHKDPRYQEEQNRALQFLLKTSGRHWTKNPQDPAAHDPSIRGWAWVDRTHSFVEPTSLALLALNKLGMRGVPRFREGIDMLLNRQLPHGGWNYGNTQVYGTELFPFIDSTGIALTALAGLVAVENIQKSISYLCAQAESCRTPLSLSWALFGLGAWGIYPKDGNAWVVQTLRRQNKFGAYGTSLLSLLALEYLCQGDFRKC